MSKFKACIKGNLINRDDFIPLADSQLDDYDSFCLEVEMRIGSEGREDADVYWIKVCSASWLRAEVSRNAKPISLHGYLLVETFDVRKVDVRIRELVSSYSGDTWQTVAAKLSRIFSWEFDK